ncbi:hypothetical protein [Chitinophaga filiformis]|uniref:Uncharacterized protein n=1 Tax=Chitinophaga filiformis TaxID=104663 RepID=A0ABY4IB77_CHIFI|nr:hypothetical protein [Chitinophaga filiformis]UPK72308.1 hypothetical protein MYF79_13520 [Chitinophaga filiformis]
MAHKVILGLPGIEVSNSNAAFVIKKDGKQIGKISISRGGVEYFKGRRQRPIKMNWTKFDEMILEFNKAK